jgi:hypothetical protein
MLGFSLVLVLVGFIVYRRMTRGERRARKVALGEIAGQF